MSYRKANQEEISQIKKWDHFFIKTHKFDEKDTVEDAFEVIASDDAFHSKYGWIVPIELYIQDIGSEIYITEKSTYITSDRIVVPVTAKAEINNRTVFEEIKRENEIDALLDKHRSLYPLTQYN